MRKDIIKITRDNRNFYLYNSNIEDTIPPNLISKDIEFRILFLSNNFSLYSRKKIEENIEYIISQNGLNEISFFGLGARQLEEIADNKITNLWMEKNDDGILSILTASEEDIKEDGFLDAFISGGLRREDNNKYVKENYIFYDDDNLCIYMQELLTALSQS